jgi:hypothetical protein
MGAGSCVLLAAAGTHLFGRRGAMAGVLLAVYPSAIFLDGLASQLGDLSTAGHQEDTSGSANFSKGSGELFAEFRTRAGTRCAIEDTG